MRSGLLIAGSLVVLVAADAVALTPFAFAATSETLFWFFGEFSRSTMTVKMTEKVI
jgi:hypothetical protein